ncbi:MAG: amino acid carrier protein [Pirellulales bacterium]
MERISNAVESFANALFVPWIFGVLFLAGAFLTIRFGFVQFRRFPEAARAMFARQQSGARGALAPFQTFMAALAATIGTGNIAGVATAIIEGGPGALFWIWCYGVLAMAVKFAEAVLGVHYRIVRGEYVYSGPMYYLRDGLGSPALAWIYAFVAGIAVLFTTPFTQPNSVAVVVESEFGVNTGLTGVVLAVLTLLVIVFGIKSIGRAAEFLSPLKVGFFVIGGLIVLLMHASRLPEVLQLVFEQAFSREAGMGTAKGAAVYVALRYGLARGVYANEAGYGTAAVMYGTAKTENPSQQGLQAMMEVFIISFVTCTLTALCLLVTEAWKSDAQSSAAVAVAFNAAMPTVGGWMVAISMFLFGYSALIGWAYYGEQFLEYIFGPRVVGPFRWLYCALIPFGAMAKVDLVWAWGDVLNGLQIFPNMIGLLALSGVAAAFALGRNKVSHDAHRGGQASSS